MAMVFTSVRESQAANATWTLATGNIWTVTTNWNTGAFPGISGASGASSTSLDVAAFESTPSSPVYYTSTSGQDLNLGGVSVTSVTGSLGFQSGSTNTGTRRIYFTAGGQGIELSSSVTGTVTFERLGISSGASGTVSFRNNAAASTAVLQLNSSLSSTAPTAVLELGGSASGRNRLDGVVSSSGTLSLIKTGASYWSLSAANTFAGGVVLESGTLGIADNSALGTGTVTINAGVLACVTNPRTVSNPMVVNGSFTLGGLGSSGTFSGNINLSGGTRAITLGNSGVISGTVSNGGLSFSNSGAGIKTLLMSGSNSYAGGTTLNSGTLAAGSVAAFGTGSLTVASGASLDLGGFAIANAITNNGGSILNAGSYAGTQTLLGSSTFSSLAGTLSVGSSGKATLNGSISGTLATLAGGTADLASGGSLTQASVTNAGKFIFSGTADASLSTTFTGAGSFQKDSGSILSLSGSSFFGAGTQITAGGLLVTGSVGGGTVDVASAASIGGSGRVGGALAFQSGANFKFVAGDTLTVGGNTTFGGAFGIANIIGVDATTPEGTYTLISGVVDFANVTNVGSSNAVSLGSGKSAYLQSGSLQMVVVPEPATLSLVAIGGLAVVLFRQRRRGQSAA
jgi:fibronectin-binding autotransporter adhesin